MTQVDRSERLINLVALLRATPRAIPLEEIAERVPGYPSRKESYRRQFERDKDELRGIGIPIVLERVAHDAYDEGRGGSVVDGYRIPREEYELPDLGLTDAERMALNVAFGAVRMSGGPGRETMWKLGTGAESARALAAIPALDELAPLLKAVRERRIARFSYRDSDREVEPYGLLFRRGHWYLVGFDHARGGARAFRVDRIVGGVTSGDAADAFAPYAGDPASLLSDDPMQFPDDEPVVARVRVDAEFVAEARVRFADATESPDPNGDVVFAVTVTNRDAFRGNVFDLLEHAEVLDPPDLRAEIVAWLRTVEGSAP